jgi:hypothetical protein
MSTAAKPHPLKVAGKLAAFLAWHLGAVIALRALAVVAAGMLALRLGAGPFAAAAAGALADHFAGLAGAYFVGDPDPNTVSSLIRAAWLTLPREVARVALLAVMRRVPVQHLRRFVEPLLAEEPLRTEVVMLVREVLFDVVKLVETSELVVEQSERG